MFANPVLIKELRSRMRGNRAMITLTIYLSIIGIVTLLVYAAVVSTLSFGTSNFEAGRQVGKAIFLTVMFVALVQVCFITPSLTAASIAGEKERQSYDLLITTLLSPWQIVLGKLMAALAYILLLIIAVLPLAGLAFLFGGVSGIELLIGMVGLVATAVLYAAIGMAWSTIMRGTQGSTSMAIGTVIMWLLGVPFLFLVSGAILFERDWMRDFTETVFFVYAAGAFLCSHPFIALGITQGLISEGESPFFFSFTPGQEEIFVPSPWIAYTAIALVLAVLLLAFSVNRIQPVEYGGGRTRKKGATGRRQTEQNSQLTVDSQLPALRDEPRVTSDAQTMASDEG